MKRKSFFAIAMLLGYTLMHSNVFSQANTALSNLAAVNINQSLTPTGNNGLSIGSTSKSWRFIYLDSAVYLRDLPAIQARGTNNFFAGLSAGNFTFTGTGNTGTGNLALNKLTTGINNTALGNFAGYNATTGSFNTSVGSYASYKSTTASDLVAIGDSALYNNFTAKNTAIGSKSMYSNVIGGENVAVGFKSLYSNSDGYNNVAIGSQSLFKNTTGYMNVAVGSQSLASNTSAWYNSALGHAALAANKTGERNVAAGGYALTANVSGSDNVGVGYHALYHNTASFNSALGTDALSAETSGSYSVAIGYRSQYKATTGFQNVGVGALSLNNLTTSNGNSAVGHASVFNVTSGYGNTGMGAYSLINATTGNNNSALGFLAGVNNSTISNSSAVGYFAFATASNQVWLGNSSVTAVWSYGGYFTVSDARFKKNVKENVPGLAFIKQLRPVTYSYDIHGINTKTGADDMRNNVNAFAKENGETALMETLSKSESESINTKEKKMYTGFLAQEVDEIAKKMNYEFNGVYKPQNDKDIYGLNYADFVVPLVKAVQELSDKNDELQARVEKLEMLLKNSPVTNIKVSEAVLEQNIPNPVKNSTSIAYTLPAKFTRAIIVISDVSGKEIKTINVNGTGKGKISLDVSALPAGNYQYSLYSDGQMTDTKKLIVTK